MATKVIKTEAMACSTIALCRRSDSNRHGPRARWILSPVRLPISPLRQKKKQSGLETPPTKEKQSGLETPPTRVY